jgi:hypothetical protein
MHRNKLACSIFVVAVAGSMWACGSDDDATSGGGGAGSGGRAGSAGRAGSGGRAGAPQGGGGSDLAGAAGETTAGAGGETTAGGQGGDGPSNAGSGGDTLGQAGDGNGQGGEGGAGGAGSPPTLEQNCATVCAAQQPLTCKDNNCVANCIAIGTDPVVGTNAPTEYATMLACEAEFLAGDNYYCSVQPSSSMAKPAPKAGTPCESSICAWTCLEIVYFDENVYGRCGC